MQHWHFLAGVPPGTYLGPLTGPQTPPPPPHTGLTVERSLPVCVQEACCCCQCVRHMLQQGRAVTRRWVNTGHTDAPITICRGKVPPSTQRAVKRRWNGALTLFVQQGRSLDGNPPQDDCVCTGMLDSQVRLGQKNLLFLPLRVSGGNAQENPGYSTRPTVWTPEEARWRDAGPSMVCTVSLLLVPRRVTGSHSHPVLATGPCWHSFSQSHVTASLHNSEARVLFRVPDWPSPAEARPKRGALIGCRSINSDCHVLMEESH